MKPLQKLTCFAIACSLLNSCKKDTNPAPKPIAKAKCRITGESTSLAQNEATTTYEYDNAGNPKTIKNYNRFGTLKATCALGSNSKVVSGTSQYNGKVIKTITEYETSDIFNNLPAKAFVSIDDGDTLRVHYWTYFFFYDAKGRLNKVGEQTDNVIGDYEYDLSIAYNDNDNVTTLRYELTTGPRDAITIVTAAAYDDKPTPYTAIKNWPLLNINFGWDNYDPEPILTALSKNNPLDYTLGSGPQRWERTMVYTYNDNGFPTERTNTNKHENQEYTFLQTFTYDCN